MDLLGILHRTFPIEPRPARLFILEEAATERDPMGDFRQRIGSQDWPSVSMHDWAMVGMHPVTVRTYLQPSTFIYYLPSLLTGGVSDSGYLDWTLEAIMPAGRDRRPKGAWWKQFSRELTSDQRGALSAFLALVRSDRWERIGDANQFLLCEAEAVWSPSNQIDG